MQNIANLLSPFFGKDGLPVSGGRVHFVKPDCSAAPTDAEDPDYIAIYDTDGMALANPLGLNDLGSFDTQPFAEDGIDFRMIVEAPTGVPAELESEAPAWSQLYIIDSKAQKISVEWSGVASVGGLPDLRKADPSSSPVVVLGYSEAGDFCPARVFQWVENLYAENYGTHVRSTLSEYKSAGTWVCEPSGLVDVRWFGAEPGSGVSASTSLSYAVDSHPNIPLYFPPGEYSLSSGLTAYSVICDRRARFSVLGGNSVTFNVRGFFENRSIDTSKQAGATGYLPVFLAQSDNDSTSPRVIPCLYGTLRTSWLGGTLNEFLTGEALRNIDLLVFDDYNEAGEAKVAVSNKVVYMINEEDNRAGISFEGCLIIKPGEDSDNVQIEDGSIQIGNTPSYSALTASLLRIIDNSNRVSITAEEFRIGAVSSAIGSQTVVNGDSVTSDNGYFENLKASGDLTVIGGATIGKGAVVDGIVEAKGLSVSGEASLANGAFDVNENLTLANSPVTANEKITAKGGLDTSGVDGDSTGLRVHFVALTTADCEEIVDPNPSYPNQKANFYSLEAAAESATTGDVYALLSPHDSRKCYYSDGDSVIWYTDYCMVSLFLYTGAEHGFRPIGKSRP